MCKSQAEGGQRCAAHTRPAYFASTPGTPEWDRAAAEYSSTPEGKKVIEHDIDLAETAGDFERAAGLTTALRNGQNLRASNQETASVIKGAREWEPGTVHPVGSYDQVQRDENGSSFYTLNGNLNRLDGPSIVHPDGSEEFWRDGEMFCEMACLRGDNPPNWCSRYE